MLGVVAMVAVPAAISWACGPNRAVELDSPTYPPGGTVQVSGRNFEPDSRVTIKVGGSAVGSATVSNSGSFGVSFAAPQASGTYVLTTEGVDEHGQPLAGVGNAVTFTVVAPPPSGPSGGPRTPNYVIPKPTAATLAGCPPGRRVLSLSSGKDNRNGTSGTDLILAGAGDDTIDALGGDDCVDLGSGDDRGQGGAGDDLVLGGDGVDRMLGDGGRDRLRGGAARDTMFGGIGNDVLHGEAGSDRASGSRGRDRIDGGGGRDMLGGGSGSDRVSGSAGNDRIVGGSANDILKGNSGNDKISGGSGRDRIACGRGIDTAVADRRDVVAGDCERIRRARD